MVRHRHEFASRMRRSPIRLLVLLLAAGVAVLFAAERGEVAMRSFAAPSRSSIAKPPIDTDVPKTIATATFAMG